MLIIMKKLFLSLVFISIVTNLFANDIATLAKELDLYPGTKATIQWERIFSSQRRLKRYGLDRLTYDELIKLKYYLIEHAADSKQPIVPGL